MERYCFSNGTLSGGQNNPMKKIGIDPGTKTGLAIWNTATNDFDLITTTTIVKAMEIVANSTEPDSEIYFEDARKRTWFGKRQSPEKEREKLQGVGSVKRDCSVWEEFCEHLGIKYHRVHPQQINTKTDAAYFKRLTGYKGRTSEHARDAAMIVFKR